jgi:undecaprenyl diphosphate synthase
MIEERSVLLDENIRLAVIGRREGIPAEVLAEIDKTIELTAANSGLRLCLAINYGSRGEIADAVRHIAGQVQSGQLSPSAIDETTIADHLYTAGMPDPDLLVRTAGEMRISNYLLWQISYAEIWVTSKFWPEFDERALHQAIREFAERDRRFGGLNE